MKATIEFNLPEEQEQYALHNKALDMHCALWDISQDVFRPARKHGYANQQLQALLDGNDEAQEVVRILEGMFYDILKERGVELP